MAKHTFTFRTFATEETDHWSPPAVLEGVPVFGLYLIMEGESTHICSFQGSTRAEFVENIWLLPREAFEPAESYCGTGTIDIESKMAQAADDLAYNNGGEACTYFDYIDCAAPARKPYLSERITVTLDSRDHDLDARQYADELADALRYDSPQKAHATARRNCLRERAWEAAHEAVRACAYQPPILSSEALYEAHRRRKVLAEARTRERYQGMPPLFAFGGIAAPLALGGGA